MKVNLDSQSNDDEPTSSQSLEQNIRFNQQNILLPTNTHPFAIDWKSNARTLHQFVASEMFKSSVAEEKANNEMVDKRIAAQLLKEQQSRENEKKEATERRRMIRDKANAERGLKKGRPSLQNGSNYFRYYQLKTLLHRNFAALIVARSIFKPSQASRTTTMKASCKRSPNCVQKLTKTSSWRTLNLNNCVNKASVIFPA